MILKNTNNFTVTIEYGAYTMSLAAGSLIDVKGYVPEILPEGVVILKENESQIITEPIQYSKKIENESVDNSKLLLG